MEIIVHNNIIATYQKQGNDVNGNPIYLVNFFQCNENQWLNYNFRYKCGHKEDKYGNIRIKSYNIQQEIKEIIDMMGE